MPTIPAKQYDVIYRGESQEAQLHPELIKGRSYVVYVREQHGQVTVTPVSRVDVEQGHVGIQRQLGIPPHCYKQVEEVAQDWSLVEWPFDWLAFRYDLPPPTSGG